jgi:pimeloyl-ACP methyl ester carboxylesterase
MWPDDAPGGQSANEGMTWMVDMPQSAGLAATVGALVVSGLGASGVQAAVPSREEAVLAAPVRHVRAGGVGFTYRAIGSGPPLMLISGTGATMSRWDPAVLARIVARHRVILYDQRGVGLSRGDVTTMTVAQLADDTAALIRALHLRRPDVWGQSLGGDVAEDLVIRHPSAVRRVVLTGASAGGGTGHSVPPAVPLPMPGDRDGSEQILFTPDAAGRAARRAFDRRCPAGALRRP